jgi:hypothetical protein
LKIIKTLTAALSVAILMGTGIAACSTSEGSSLDRAKAAGMNDSQALACDDLARKGKTIDANDGPGKIDAARTVNAWAPLAGEKLRAAGSRLTLAANSGGPETWTSAVNHMASECISLGWPTK